MNRFKRGEQLYGAISSAHSNARFCYEQYNDKKYGGPINEKKYLEELISKAKSRIVQIEEDLKKSDKNGTS